MACITTVPSYPFSSVYTQHICAHIYIVHDFLHKKAIRTVHGRDERKNELSVRPFCKW